MRHLIGLLFLLLSTVSASAAQYALVNVASNAVVERRDFATTPPDVSRKGIKWLPVVAVDPAFDSTTQNRSGPVTTVNASQVTDTWTVVNKTPAEIDDDKAGQISRLNVATFRALCHLKNETRRLSTPSLPAWTQAECATAFKGLLP